jgi:protein-S-isoprenylcysteine O-methyltransferase Ste14
MAIDDLTLRRAVVFASALVYWTGVFVQILRVRKRTGRSANSRPRGLKERLLWIGWILVVVLWIAIPLLVGHRNLSGLVPLFPSLATRPVLALGLVSIVAGYLGTLWCYAIMGDAWRMGIDRNERNRLVTRGPYGVVRHPIYALQVLMLAGVALLLPTPLTFFILVLHYLCAWFKAVDEESYLVTVHGAEYRAYLARTGRLFPRILPAG